MKKSMIFGTLFLFFLIAIQSNAEMRITEDGVTFPDDSFQTKAVSGGGVSAPLNLSGSLHTEGYSINPSGAIISGENKYSGTSYSYGGYFTAAGAYGNGVYGSASGNSGWGVFGSAVGPGGRGVYGIHAPLNNVYGVGVYGSATSSTGIGVFAIASGSNGRAVDASASNEGNVKNYGGYFEAKGSLGTGVYGYASNKGNTINQGGHFQADGAFGIGVNAEALGSNSTGVRGVGEQYDFYADGTGNYGAFTGAHEVQFAEDMPEEIVPGLIVSTTGKTEARKDKNGRISISSTLPTVKLSTKTNDKAVFGVIVSDGPLAEDHWYESQEDESFGVVNALGEGRVWVTNRNGNIENGDYVTTSEIPGYGQLQNDDLLHSYTLGKAIETIDWERVTETIEDDGETYKRYLIAIVYTSG